MTATATITVTIIKTTGCLDLSASSPLRPAVDHVLVTRTRRFETVGFSLTMAGADRWVQAGLQGPPSRRLQEIGP